MNALNVFLVLFVISLVLSALALFFAHRKDKRKKH